MSDDLMHDWSLETIEVNWPEQTARFTFCAAKLIRNFIAHGLVRIEIPQENSWGPSKYIDHSEGLDLLEGGNQRVRIAMSSGDTIEICAQKIKMPEAVDQALFTDRLPLGRERET